MNIIWYIGDNVDLGRGLMVSPERYGLGGVPCFFLLGQIVMVCVQIIPPSKCGRRGCLGCWVTIELGAEKKLCVSISVNYNHWWQGCSVIFFYCIRFAKLDEVIHIYSNVDCISPHLWWSPCLCKVNVERLWGPCFWRYWWSWYTSGCGCVVAHIVSSGGAIIFRVGWMDS